MPINIAAPEDNIRNKTVEQYKKFIEAAVELECPQMLLCPGRPYWTGRCRKVISMEEILWKS